MLHYDTLFIPHPTFFNTHTQESRLSYKVVGLENEEEFSPQIPLGHVYDETSFSILRANPRAQHELMGSLPPKASPARTHHVLIREVKSLRLQM